MTIISWRSIVSWRPWPRRRTTLAKRREFDELILVAPRRSLGELRGLLSKRVQGRVRIEVSRDLTNETVASLWQRLDTLVKPGV